MVPQSGTPLIDPSTVFRALAAARVRYVVVGGVALMLQGSSYVTMDIDIAYDRTRDNANRLAGALAPFQPRPRGMAASLPFIFDAQAILGSQVLTLETSIGDIDLLGEIKGIGAFEAVDAQAEDIIFEDVRVRTLSVDGLPIKGIRAAQGEG
ncbi:MAG: hypothetical protein NVSMB64_28760 [Candidatus Velthaea sp.]